MPCGAAQRDQSKPGISRARAANVNFCAVPVGLARVSGTRLQASEIDLERHDGACLCIRVGSVGEHEYRRQVVRVSARIRTKRSSSRR